MVTLIADTARAEHAAVGAAGRAHRTCDSAASSSSGHSSGEDDFQFESCEFRML